MILIGQFDSPFTRRIGITMRLYGLAFEHRPWSVFGDAEKIRPYNPLLRVPVLVLADGEALIESQTILDYLDNQVPAEKRLIPAEEPARRQVLRICALAAGISDKAVSLFYEQRLHETVSDFYVARCRAQILDTLQALEASRKAGGDAFWFGDTISQADITFACVLRHLNEAHPGLADMHALPALAAHAFHLEALPVFRAIYQPFITPKG